MRCAIAFPMPRRNFGNFVEEAGKPFPRQESALVAVLVCSTALLRYVKRGWDDLKLIY